MQAFNIDFHIHSAKHSECAESLAPHLIEKYAVKAGLHGVVITEHDTLWNKRDFSALKESFDHILLFNGVEVTTKNGYHIILLGIDQNGPLKKGIGCEDAIHYAHERGGIVILAHPFRNGLPPMKTIEQVDAIEIGSTSLHLNESKLSRCLAESLGKPGIACSDAHALTMIGWAFTSFPLAPENEKHLCAMIKEGLGRPVLPHCFFA